MAEENEHNSVQTIKTFVQVMRSTAVVNKKYSALVAENALYSRKYRTRKVVD